MVNINNEMHIPVYLFYMFECYKAYYLQVLRLQQCDHNKEIMKWFDFYY